MKTPIETLEAEIKVFKKFIDYLNKDKERIVSIENSDEVWKTLIQDSTTAINKHREAIDILGECSSVAEVKAKSWFCVDSDTEPKKDRCKQQCEWCKENA